MWGELSKRTIVGIVLAAVSGLLMLLDGILWVGSWGFQTYVWGNMLSPGDAVVGSVKIVLALVVLAGALLAYRPGRELLSGGLVLVFSIVGLFFASHIYIVAMIPGIIGGTLILSATGKEPPEVHQK
jgi:hypothetical protein